ncbi:hypothetical protein HNY73_022843 [Argiope bruennichi]|uniref:Uncharacterized protein n=1 Tax=Argiope bruennichi TaxID=94029 RepID=A0A8T0E3L4_ARGBR|nr:hypothetical protein HNY73_022843 [Argiope bruennichi]
MYQTVNFSQLLHCVETAQLPDVRPPTKARSPRLHLLLNPAPKPQQLQKTACPQMGHSWQGLKFEVFIRSDEK